MPFWLKLKKVFHWCKNQLLTSFSHQDRPETNKKVVILHLIGDFVSSILANLLRMVTQSEEILEQGLIKTLQEMNYEYISIKEEENLYANFKLQLEKHNRKELALHGRESFTDKEFDKILLYLEGGTRFEKAKKLRDLKDFQLENGERVWIEFINKQQWCQNEFQVSNQITVEGRKKCRYDVTILVNGLP